MRLLFSRAFTLLEVLVALTIFATVAATVLVSVGRSLYNAGRLEEKLLAGWIADNYLTELQLRRSAPSPGREALTLEYAGRRWTLTSTIESTSDQSLQRVRVSVSLLGEQTGIASQQASATLEMIGFLSVQP